jgi:hypothetical protein
MGIGRIIKKALTKVVHVKRLLRGCAQRFFYFIAGGEVDKAGNPTDFNKANKIYFGLLIYRIVCKNIYMIACLGVLGCAIALPFVSQLQSFLHLNHFVKLIFENNWHAIAKLTAVAFSSLLCIAAYLAQVIVSIKSLNYGINIEKEGREQAKRMTKEEYNEQRSFGFNLDYGEYENISKNYIRIISEYSINDHEFRDNCFSTKGILSNT